jgi:hypothetical protein
VGFLGLVETGILSSAANDIFIATCFGIGAVGLLIGGLWEFRGGELFGGTFKHRHQDRRLGSDPRQLRRGIPG